MYDDYGATAPLKATITVRRSVLPSGGHFFPPERRVMLMMTYSEFFLLGSLIVSIIALVVNITRK